MFGPAFEPLIGASMGSFLVDSSMTDMQDAISSSGAKLASAEDPVQRLDLLHADTLASVISRNQVQAELLEEQRNRAQLAERHSELLTAVVAASELLLKTQNLEHAAKKVIEQIGKALAADRCTIGVYLPPDENDPCGYVDFQYEWVNTGIARQTDQPGLKVFATSLYIDFLKPWLRGEAISLITKDIDNGQARNEQELTGAKSQFQYPIMVDGKFWGCLGADDCHHPRVWSHTEIDSLRLVASALASVVKREQLVEARLAAERDHERARREGQVAVAAERNRIAREIHDTLAQGFTGVIMQSQAAEDALQKSDAPAVVHHLYRARHIAQTSLHDARRSVFALRPSILENQTLAQALSAQLKNMLADTLLVGTFEEQGHATAASNLVATEFLRIAQEATTNVLRHARATNMKVLLAWNDGKVALHVEDDGQGFDARQLHAGFGLVSMRERADRMEAALIIHSSKTKDHDRGKGTKVSLMVDPDSGGYLADSSATASGVTPA